MFDRGQRLDWFESDEILLWAFLAVIGCYLFIAHSLTAAHPFLDMRMFRDRNFVVGLILMFVFGLVSGGGRAGRWTSGGWRGGGWGGGGGSSGGGGWSSGSGGGFSGGGGGFSGGGASGRW